MNLIISEKDYPIQGAWVFKSIVSLVIALIFFSARWLSLSGDKTVETYLYLLIVLIVAISTPIYLINTMLSRTNFHYAVEENFLTLNQGILSKQQRHIPYGVIQNIFAKQDLLDRIFGLASLTIENASQVSDAQKRRQSREVGFSGNRVNIPGLKKIDAETLKDLILKKMKENPTDDNQSGL